MSLTKEEIEKFRRLANSTNALVQEKAKEALAKAGVSLTAEKETPKAKSTETDGKKLSDAEIEKFRRLANSTNALVQEKAKEALAKAGVSLTAEKEEKTKPKQEEKKEEKDEPAEKGKKPSTKKTLSLQEYTDAIYKLLKKQFNWTNDRVAEAKDNDNVKKAISEFHADEVSTALAFKQVAKIVTKQKAAADAGDEFDCDKLIAQAKKRAATRKKLNEKRRNAPKHTPATKNKMAIKKASDRVEKSVVSRAKKGKVNVSEIEKMIAEYKEAIKRLEALLKKVKSGAKFAEGGNVDHDLDEEDARELHDIKEHTCKCGGKMAKGGKIDYLKDWDVVYTTFQSKPKAIKLRITLGRLSDKDDVKNELKRRGLNIWEVISITEVPKMAKGGKVESDEVWYIDYMDKKKGFQQTRKTFKGEDAYDKAVAWGQKNLGNFSYDMVKIQRYAEGGNLDGHYGAEKAGERRSRKYAVVEVRGGGTYTRRNANQFGKVKGGNTYHEGRENRSDKRKYFATGGNIDKDGMLYFITEEMSAGMIAAKLTSGKTDYKHIDAVRNKMVSILQKEGDQKYSMAAAVKLVRRAEKEL